MTEFNERYGPWAVIAGASEGTGRCLAHRIAAEGVDCLLVGRRAAPLDTLAGEIAAAHGVACETASIDLSLPDVAERVSAAAGGREIGLFVSNAGADVRGSRFLDRTAAECMELVNLNVVTMMRCCHHFAGPMRARGRGGLLLMNSGACYLGMSTLAVYAAGKAFMLAFAEGLWAELRGEGVDVLTMVMGQTDTPAYRRYMADKGLPFPADQCASPDEVARVALARLPLGPVHHWGLDDDQAGFAPQSAAAIRRRIESIEAMRRDVIDAG